MANSSKAVDVEKSSSEPKSVNVSMATWNGIAWIAQKSVGVKVVYAEMETVYPTNCVWFYMYV